jgi:hypothetical protein
MRHVLLSLVLVASGCAFYAPTVADCTVACAGDGACPHGFSCVGAFCRRTGTRELCECRAGETRVCGSAVGECRVGAQSCSASGVWGECVGEVKPTPEVCDEKDNDCDGLVDVGPERTLATDLSTQWNLYGYDGGYALMRTRGQADGGEEVVVSRYDTDFNLLSDSAPLRGGPLVYEATAAVGSTVYVGWAEGTTVSIFAVEADGTIRPFETVTTTDGSYGLHLGASEQVVGNWLMLSTVEHALLGRWDLDGGLLATAVLDDNDAGAGVIVSAPYSINLSQQGHYSIYTADVDPDAGFPEFVARVVQDTTTLQVLRIDGPYMGTWYAPLIEQPAVGTLTVTYSYNDGASWSGVYFNPDLKTLTTFDEKTVEETRASRFLWGESAAALQSNGNIAIAYADNGTQRLILARSSGIGATAEVPIKRPLDPSLGYGPPGIAEAGNDPMLGLAWSSLGAIHARRVCGPP